MKIIWNDLQQFGRKCFKLNWMIIRIEVLFTYRPRESYACRDKLYWLPGYNENKNENKNHTETILFYFNLIVVYCFHQIIWLFSI